MGKTLRVLFGRWGGCSSTSAPKLPLAFSQVLDLICSRPATSWMTLTGITSSSSLPHLISLSFTIQMNSTPWNSSVSSSVFPASSYFYFIFLILLLLFSTFSFFIFLTSSAFYLYNLLHPYIVTSDLPTPIFPSFILQLPASCNSLLLPHPFIFYLYVHIKAPLAALLQF